MAKTDEVPSYSKPVEEQKATKKAPERQMTRKPKNRDCQQGISLQAASGGKKREEGEKKPGLALIPAQEKIADCCMIAAWA
ncbi:hypothetical protein Y1Q_0010728 [Alligator mississippiensis]|uniref:Uncharacterized protein n=1 Tax=Alligator mississippiensis TaxID=8496 RepID=A0A151M6M4_ALLMI|nr:hypothetical protein Y1Q_0010728 [Alligator mississippiensis]